MKKIVAIMFCCFGLFIVGCEQKECSDIICFEKKCNNKNFKSCEYLGNIYSLGELGIRQDYAKAVEYFTKACDGGVARSCGSLGVSYLNGQGVRQDYAKALNILNKACDKDDAVSCFGVGILYESGVGVEKDISQAKEYFGKACDLGLQDGCEEYRNLNK
ncbi:MAG: sel1 repeat family protein [Campylobacteraceae bacterium]|jgi:TPR repeat protein|nr:sel1 repeat family protein [Campylobacteraceae bacterium]